MSRTVSGEIDQLIYHARARVDGWAELGKFVTFRSQERNVTNFLNPPTDRHFHHHARARGDGWNWVAPTQFLRESRPRAVGMRRTDFLYTIQEVSRPLSVGMSHFR